MDRKLESFPRAHTHSDPSSINTQKQVKKLQMDLSWHWLTYICYRSKLSITLKSKDWATGGFPKNFQTHPPRPT